MAAAVQPDVDFAAAFRAGLQFKNQDETIVIDTDIVKPRPVGPGFAMAPFAAAATAFCPRRQAAPYARDGRQRCWE